MQDYGQCRRGQISCNHKWTPIAFRPLKIPKALGVLFAISETSQGIGVCDQTMMTLMMIISLRSVYSGLRHLKFMQNWVADE